MRQGDLLLGESFDAVPDDIDAALVAGIKFEDGFFVSGAEELAGEAKDGGRFADAGHTADDDVGHVAIFGDDLEAGDGFGVADYVVEIDWSVLLDPWEVRKKRVVERLRITMEDRR